MCPIQDHLESCCARKFGQLKQTIEDELKREEEIFALAEVDQELELFGTGRWERFKTRLFLMLERPHSSLPAKVTLT